MATVARPGAHEARVLGGTVRRKPVGVAPAVAAGVAPGVGPSAFWDVVRDPFAGQRRDVCDGVRRPVSPDAGGGGVAQDTRAVVFAAGLRRNPRQFAHQTGAQGQ